MLNVSRSLHVEKTHLSLYVGSCYIIGVTVTLHLLFSWMGFFFSDDGMNLAFARRIVEGQIPHRDFITLRPAGTALLFAPFVKYGGDYVYLLSRFFVFFQYTFVSWAWVRIFVKQLKIELGFFQQILFALGGLVFSLTTFQVVPSYTIDGLFWISLGLLLWSSGETFWNRFFAYACMGLSVICKQSYIFFLLGIPFLLKEQKNARFWIAAFLPSFFYVCVITLLQALPDFIDQITAQNSLFRFGFAHFLKNHLFWWGILSGIVCTTQLNKKNHLSTFFFLAICSLGFLAALEIAQINKIFFYSYLMSGISVGVLLGLTIKYGWKDPLVRLGSTSFLLAWCSSLSLASLPILYGWGLVFQFLLIVAFYSPNTSLVKIRQVLISSCLIFASVTMILYARYKFVYCQCSAKEITCSMKKVLPGWKGIKVHKATFIRIKDLKNLLKKYSGQPYTILPNFAAYWATSKEKNPLPEDWIMSSELNTQPLIARMIKHLENERGKLMFVIQKFEATLTGLGFCPITKDFPCKDHLLITFYVKEHFQKIDETDFYEVYR